MQETENLNIKEIQEIVVSKRFRSWQCHRECSVTDGGVGVAVPKRLCTVS